MRIAIVGYGRMGKLIEAEALHQDLEIGAVIDPVSTEKAVTATKVDEAALAGCDVAIDFSHPDSVVDNILCYARLALPAVIGTTGWYDRLDEIRSAIDEKHCSIIYSGNYSLGVAIYLQVVRYASRLFDRVGGYDSYIQEIHHAGKADSPSGTARMLADAVLENSRTKRKIVEETLHRRREEDEIQVSSVRGGSVAGTHTVAFDSPVDTVELTHRARSREGFAVGAVKAARWIVEKREGVFTLDDMLGDLLGPMEETT